MEYRKVMVLVRIECTCSILGRHLVPET